MPLDVSALLVELAPYLNAASAADADLYFWTAAELYQFADDAVKDLARKTMCFAAAPDPIVMQAAQVTAPLPEGAIAVVSAAFNGLPLRETNVPEVEALDDAWDTNQATPQKWLEDLGLGAVRPYPTTPAAGVLTLVVQAFPGQVSAGSATLEAPAPIAGYLFEAILGRARQKQSDAMMPEVAAHCAQRAAMYQQICAEYWGSGE